MKEIPLSQGYVALVDDEDYPALAQKKWYCGRRDSGLLYAVNSNTLEYMHRVLMRAPKGVPVDHVNGNGLDNRRANLRLVTQQQNTRTRNRTCAKSGVVGVVFDPVKKGRKPWRAYIHTDGKRIYLGRFLTKDEAIAARRSGAKQLFGDFAGTA